MKHKRRWLYSLCVGLTACSAAFSQDLQAKEWQEDFLAAVSSLHGITEEDAINRLAAESEAAFDYRLVRGLGLGGYAGAWFDEQAERLVVATSSERDRNILSAHNIDSVQVERDLRALEVLAAEVFEDINSQEFASGPTVLSIYADALSNSVVVVVVESSRSMVEQRVQSRSYRDAVLVRTFPKMPRLSTGTVRAAKGTRNLTWASTEGGVWPCSVGASTENGFVWAGHCGEEFNEIGDESNVLMGQVVSSTWWPTSQPSIDAGNVNTEPGWTLTPSVQGYTDGIFNVNTSWSGIVEFPINTTVCRYGGTSGGPHCGTIDQKNVQVTFGSKTVVALTQVEGSCSDDGDSGGPHIAGVAQMQGVNVGVWRFNAEDECPTAARYVWFQPMKQVLSEVGEIMLTPHGASAPLVTSALCPEPGSPPGHYLCTLFDFDSQGTNSFLWTSNTGNSSNSLTLAGTCTPGAPVQVNLEVTNPYGTTLEQYAFSCPN